MKKALTIVLTLALALSMCIGLASCSNDSGATVAANHYEIKINSLSEYSAEKSIPVKLGQGSGIFGFDGWILTGTKTPIDDNTGEATDAYWTLTLDVEDTAVDGVVDYTFGLNYYAAPSSAYTQPLKAMYTFTGKGYPVDGGYHLFTPTYAEATITGQCMEETPGWRADTGEALTAVAPDGSKLFFYYTNSNLQLSGYEFGFPLNGNLVASMFESDFIVDGDSITEFKNVTENLSDLAPASSGNQGGGDAGSGGDNGGEGGSEG